MSSRSALASPLRPAHGYVYSAVCLALAAAGLASGRVVAGLLLVVGVLAYLALSAAGRTARA